MKRRTHNFRRAIYSALILLILGLTGCSEEAQAPLGMTTTTTTLPPPPQASLVLGQGTDPVASSTRNGINFVDAAGIFSPRGIAVDAVNDRLYVADAGNSRVLVFNNLSALTTNGTAADIVIGQADLNSYECNRGGTVSENTLCRPAGLAVDSLGRLYVADTENNRVLVYTDTITTGMNANIVLGQSDFSTNTDNAGGLGASSLSAPAGVAIDGSGNLFVADTGNHRVLEYNASFSTNAAAARVFGQTDMSSNLCNKGATASNISLCNPRGAAVDSAGNLYVADTSNNRVLEYDTPLISGTTADRVFGQGSSFTAVACGTSATGLCLPSNVGLDSSDNVYIADTNNSRVFEYTTPVASVSLPQAAPITAAKVFGQGDVLTTAICNNTAVAVGGLSSKSLCNPQSVALDSSGNLYIADTGNSRILQYVTPLTTDTVADIVLGQLAFTTNGINFVDEIGLNAPKGMAVDKSVTPNRLYIADTQNNRILGYSDVSLLATGALADIVIGQPDFNSNRCNQGATASAATLCGPRGIAVDSSGNLYVADRSNSRVLEYDAPITTGMPASKIFGQSSLTASSCAASPTASTLCFPAGVTVDSSGNLYAADTSNHRILTYAAPLTTPGMAATTVFGQANFANKICNDTSAAIGGLSAKSLCFPEGLAFDSADNLYVADTGNSRVLEYDSPLMTDTTADTVIGQPNFFSNASSPVSETSLFFPAAVALDSSDNLFVADTNNSRVLVFDEPLTTDSIADDVIGQPDFASSLCNNSVTAIGGLSDRSLCFPEGVVLDGSDNLYIADTNNNRVLQFGP